ncbi:hypothetical protein K3175_07370 [Qipengyuania sp. GH1]|uniref:serine O-acetyltransferase n=1 Tax=Qipengyuania aestuarii TaxID=2867241 RepID=UPI001C888E23|nr:hypothetical protein [Qipengyuania aestuarii]MBX7535478.1 hypothetical protein [Qipengyuania aestuarii]
MSKVKQLKYSVRPGDLKGILLGPTTRRCAGYIRVSQYLREKGLNRLAKFFSQRLQATGNYISSTARIDRSVKFPHPTAIVIGSGVIVEEKVVIFQSVTLGGARMGDFQRNNYPIIGAGTVIFSGTAIIGKVRVGRNCVIGANSVVLSDIPDNSVCVGAPARIVSTLPQRNMD